jgi:hypothetical protein
MHVDAVGAPVDLRHPQVHKVDQPRGSLDWRTHPYTPPSAFIQAGEAAL